MRSLLSFSMICLLCVALFRASIAADNCAITQAELTAKGDKCIQLSLCNPGAICSFAYFPVCGAYLMIIGSLLYVRKLVSHVICFFLDLGCDNETYFNSCNARGAGVGTYTVGACGGTKSLRERA